MMIPVNTNAQRCSMDSFRGGKGFRNHPQHFEKKTDWPTSLGDGSLWQPTIVWNQPEGEQYQLSHTHILVLNYRIYLPKPQKTPAIKSVSTPNPTTAGINRSVPH